MTRLVLVSAVMLLVGCSQSFYSQGRKLADEGHYDQAISAFYQEIAANPQSMESWRELGVAFYNRGDLDKAEDALKQADQIRPDARSSLYLGLIYEKREMTDHAIRAYGAALSLEPGGKTANLIRANLDRLLSERAKREVDLALQNEASIDIDTIPDNTVAVVDFDGSFLNPDMAPLATGLAEFTAIDLSKVRSLRVIERLKIDAIMDELELSASSAVDRATAPRLGRLLGGKHLVTGSVLGLGETGVRVDGVIVNTVDSSTVATEPTEAQIREIFKAQKQFVFTVLEDLGVELTQEERDAISEVPTESYLALLAYGRGLEYRRRGMWREAEASFAEATTIDPGFAEAGRAASTVGAGLSLGGPGYSGTSFEAAITSISAPAQSTAGLDTRLRSTVINIGPVTDPNTRRPVTQPPIVGGTSTVVIEGDLNGD